MPKAKGLLQFETNMLVTSSKEEVFAFEMCGANKCASLSNTKRDSFGFLPFTLPLRSAIVRSVDDDVGTLCMCKQLISTGWMCFRGF